MPSTLHRSHISVAKNFALFKNQLIASALVASCIYSLQFLEVFTNIPKERNQGALNQAISYNIVLPIFVKRYKPSLTAIRKNAFDHHRVRTTFVGSKECRLRDSPSNFA